MENTDIAMMPSKDVPCCPDLAKERCCERLIYTYRLLFNQGDIQVEVAIKALFERCPGPLALGDLVYSTTLLPGEKVRLFTSNRKNRFTFDSSSQVSYRHEQSSEESFYMSTFDRSMSDFSTRDDISASNSSSSSFKTDGSVSGAVESLLFGPSASVSGSFNGSSTSNFLREVSGHAESSHERSVAATRASSSISVGEVQTRNHAEGESESTFESATRTISNENRCHAVTYFAYQLDKMQTVRFKILAVLRRVIDPAGDAKVDAIPPRFNGAVSVIPQGVLATADARLSQEAIGRTSALADRANLVVGGVTGTPATGGGGFQTGGVVTRNPAVVREAARLQPIALDREQAALKEVDEQLAAAGIIDREKGGVSPQLQAELSFERTTCIPTSAILVKGCIDECNVCETELQKSIELDLERKALENQLLAKQIDLLEKSHEYRCCPAGETEDEDA